MRRIEVKVGKIGVGGDNPVRIQSMTNTPTENADLTAKQIMELADAGSELVRFTVMDNHGAESVPKIKEILEKNGYDVPLIGDFHFNGHLLLQRYPQAAEILDKFRINPGNVGFGDKHDDNFKTIIDIANNSKKPVRIGVNFGSIDQRVFMKLMDDNSKQPAKEQKTSEELTVDSMLISAKESLAKALEYGMPKDKIILSTKVSNVQSLVHSYTRLAKETTQPLHLGLTEAGMGTKGVIASSAGLSILLHQGIGDTIRVSLTPEPGASRTEEVKAAQLILQVNGIRSFMPTVTSCPGCGRTSSSLFQEMSKDINTFLQKKAPEWRKKGYKGFESMKVAVMGCIVNGPGESREANIGISLPGSGEDPMSPIFIDGKQVARLKGKSQLDEFKKMIEEYVEKNYS